MTKRTGRVARSPCLPLTLSQSWCNAATNAPLRRPQHAHAPAVNLQQAGGKLPDCFGIGLALSGEDTRGERLRSVVACDGHARLDDDRAVVVLIVGKVHGTAAHFRPPLKH